MLLQQSSLWSSSCQSRYGTTTTTTATLTNVTRRQREAFHRINCRLFAANGSTSSDSSITKSVKDIISVPSKKRPPSSAVALSVTAACSLILVCYETRQWRRKQMQQLTVLDNEMVWNDFYKNNYSNTSLSSSPLSFPDLVQTVQRMGLMGKHNSVHAELDDIRKWHVDRGFKGGLILRDLHQPLFADASEENSSSSSNDQNQTQESSQDDERNLEWRECYYLYYEIKGTGEIQQQLFCRGTTLAVDIWTCLQSWMVYDTDLNCSVHRGFRNHADRILHDVLPLLAPPTDRRATIHVCGHSLGGAVASILAVKLQKRGYRVTRLTTVGEPRSCASTKHAERLARQLPRDAIRVEHELDFVTFLPPFGSKHRAGPKIWLLRDGTMRLVPSCSPCSATSSSSIEESSNKSSPFSIFSLAMFDDPLWWTDSVWVNFLAWEVLSARARPHRIPGYVDQLSKLLPP